LGPVDHVSWAVCLCCGNAVSIELSMCEGCGCEDIVPPADDLVRRIETVNDDGSSPPGRSWTAQLTQGPRRTHEGKWAHVYRFMDRDGDLYEETILDANGNETRRIHEPLSVHAGRGTARRAQD